MDDTTQPDATCDPTLPKPAELAEAVSISMPYSYMILSGRRVPPQDLALRIWRRFGVKFGVLADLSNDDIAELARIFPENPAAPEVPTTNGATFAAAVLAVAASDDAAEAAQ